MAQGARKVLNTLGYEMETTEGLTFALGEPQRLKVGAVAMDLLVAIAELEHYTLNQAPYPQHIDSLLPPAVRFVF